MWTGTQSELKCNNVRFVLLVYLKTCWECYSLIWYGQFSTKVVKVILALSQSNSNLPMVSSETPVVKSVGLEVHLLSDPEWMFFWIFNRQPDEGLCIEALLSKVILVNASEVNIVWDFLRWMSDLKFHLSTVNFYFWKPSLKYQHVWFDTQSHVFLYMYLT